MRTIGMNVALRLLALLLTPPWFLALYLLVYGEGPNANLQWLAYLLLVVVHVGGAVVVYLLHRSWGLAVLALLVPPIALPILAFKDLGDALAQERERQRAAGLAATDDVGSLVQALGDGRSRVQEQARQRLRQIGPAAIGPLLSVLPRAVGWQLQGVVQALDELGWKPTPDLAGAYYWAARGEWNKCVEIGSPAVEALLQALRTAHYSQQGPIMQALGAIGDPRATQVLTSGLTSRQPEVREAAAQSLGQLGVPAEKVESVVAEAKKRETARSTAQMQWVLAGVVVLIVVYVALIVLVFFQPGISLWAATILLIPTVVMLVLARGSSSKAKEKLAGGCVLSLLPALGGGIILLLAWIFQREAFLGFFKALGFG